jgi:hypothetical protein
MFFSPLCLAAQGFIMAQGFAAQGFFMEHGLVAHGFAPHGFSLPEAKTPLEAASVSVRDRISRSVPLPLKNITPPLYLGTHWLMA